MSVFPIHVLGLVSENNQQPEFILKISQIPVIATEDILTLLPVEIYRIKVLVVGTKKLQE